MGRAARRWRVTGARAWVQWLGVGVFGPGRGFAGGASLGDRSFLRQDDGGAGEGGGRAGGGRRCEGGRVGWLSVLLSQLSCRLVDVEAFLDLVFGTKLFTARARRIVGTLDVADANRAAVFRL